MVLGFLMIFIVFNQNRPRLKIFKIDFKRNIILFTVFNFATIYFLFFKTEFGLNGLYGDNWYRSAFLTRLSSSGVPIDFAYKDLSAFYSPLYWYILAIYARFFQIAPYKMIKLGILFFYFLLPILLFECWKKIYNSKISFIITALSFLIIGDTCLIDHIISVFFLVPFIIYYYENYPEKEFKIYNYIIAGFIGSLLLCTFFYYFLIIPVYFFISLLQKGKHFLRSGLKRYLWISIFIIIFSSWYWAPLFRDILIYGFESHQNNYFNIWFVEALPIISYFSFSILGGVILSGFIYLIIKRPVSRDIRILGNLLIAVYLIFIIGLLGIIFFFPIMHIRFLDVFLYLLIISSSIFYVRIFKFINRKKFLKNYKLDLDIQQIELFFLGFLISSYIHSNLIDLYSSTGYEYAFTEGIPHDIVEKISELDYKGKVFLMNDWKVAAIIPINLFIVHNPHYSHPSSLYSQRVEFLIKLSLCNDSNRFHENIINNKFGPIDYFFLNIDNSSKVHFFYAFIDFFPIKPYNILISFDNELFEDDDLFEEIEIGIEDRVLYRTIY
ncbi:MAG: arabinofuranosyltransferase [Candidatus Lokiarchaeota archaeon]|nr:arabinofuranosyltransferase [Candidatus Lokiarchaeota archaeon]